MSIVLRDFDGMPYMNDWVDINILFGQSNFLSSVPVGPVPQFVQPFGTGAGSHGLIYPEIYLPENRQLLIDVNHSCVAGGGPDDLILNFLGSAVYEK
jgi:hypothetical protein